MKNLTSALRSRRLAALNQAVRAYSSSVSTLRSASLISHPSNDHAAEISKEKLKKLTALPNGLRVATESIISAKIATVGVDPSMNAFSAYSSSVSTLRSASLISHPSNDHAAEISKENLKKLTALPNGLRVATESIFSAKIATVGVDPSMNAFSASAFRPLTNFNETRNTATPRSQKPYSNQVAMAGRVKRMTQVDYGGTGWPPVTDSVRYSTYVHTGGSLTRDTVSANQVAMVGRVSRMGKTMSQVDFGGTRWSPFTDSVRYSTYVHTGGSLTRDTRPKMPYQTVSANQVAMVGRVSRMGKRMSQVDFGGTGWRRCFCSGPGKTLAEVNLEVHENLWRRFFEWLARALPWLGSRYGTILTKLAAVSVCYLERFHFEQVGSRKRPSYTNQQALNALVSYVAPKSSHFTMNIISLLFNFLWSIVKEIGRGMWFVGFVTAFATFTTTGGKMARSFFRRLGFNLVEPTDKVEELEREATKLKSDVAQMNGKIAKLEFDFALSEIRRRS